MMLIPSEEQYPDFQHLKIRSSEKRENITLDNCKKMIDSILKKFRDVIICVSVNQTVVFF